MMLALFFNGTVVVINAKGAKLVMRFVATASGGLDQLSGVSVKH